MDESIKQPTLEQLATQRHQEIIANETIYNSEGERTKTMADPSYPFQGNLSFTMPSPGITQISGMLEFIGGPTLEISGSTQGFGYTGQISIPYTSGRFTTNPSSLTGIPLALSLDQATSGSYQMEIDIYNQSHIPIGFILTPMLQLLPVRNLIGQGVLKEKTL